MSVDRLFSLQRQERVLDELRLKGSVRVRDLAHSLGVSELTVRRDISALAERNLLTRVHGGATLPVTTGAYVKPAPRVPIRFTIGMVVPSLDFYWPPIIAGARAAAAALGVNLQLRGSSYDQADDRRQITRLVEAHQVQGLLLAPSLTGDRGDDMLNWIGQLPVPTVLVERQPARWTPTPRQLEWACSDHALGLEIAVHHLYRQGHRHIGLVLSRDSPTSAHLVKGWQAVCADLDLPDKMVIRQSVALHTPRHRELIADILGRCARNRITALVVHSDPDAISVAQFCAERGVSIPDDLAIVSYDDEVADLAEPALTAIRPPKNHVGRLTVELMVSRLLEGAKRPSQRVLVAPELVIRGSSMSRAG